MAKRFSSATNYEKGIRGNLSRGMPCAWLGVRWVSHVQTRSAASEFFGDTARLKNKGRKKKRDKLEAAYLFIYLFIFKIASTKWWGIWQNRKRLQFKCDLTDNPSCPGWEVGHTCHRGLRHRLFSNSGVGSFTVPQEPGNKWKCCETGPTVFRPYPRRLESLTVCRCSTFCSVILRLWVVAQLGWTRNLPLSRPALSQMS